MAISPLSAPEAVNAADLAPLRQMMSPQAPAGGSFAQLLMNGIEQVDQKVVEADQLAAAFAVDDSIPVHRVTYALEQARLSFELMLQVRARLVEAYQEVARMQL